MTCCGKQIYKITPSILSADLSNLASVCQDLIQQKADWIHIDVMDGHFVPNLTFGAPVVKCLRSNSEGFFNVHAMVQNPAQWVDDFKNAGVDNFCFHLEATYESLDKMLKQIIDSGMQTGVALNPKTPISQELIEAIDNKQVDLITIMTVQPGFGGQKFQEEPLEKVKFLREKYPNLDIQVDGGVQFGETLIKCVQAGANVIVSGTGIIQYQRGTEQAILDFRKQIKETIEQK